MKNRIEYSIITSFKKEDRDNIFCYYYKLLKTIIKLFLYSISFNQKKIKKYKIRLNYELKYGKHKIIGHQAVLMSLFRGFQKLNINYEYNRITKHTKNVIILWCDHNDLEIIRKLKQKFQTIKIVTAPTASGKAGHLFTTFQYEFAKLPYIDCSLVASDWVKKHYKTKIDSKYWDKIKIWPSGVELQVNNDKNREIKPKLSCICYYKYHKTINNNLSSYLSNLGINNYILEYPNYKYEVYMELLDKVDFVIFYQDCIETQGLAIAEAWAANKPTLIKLNKNEFNGTTCPYLCSENGLSWSDFSELKEILLNYKNNPLKFLKNFSPQEFIRKNMSDEVSVKKLIEIFEEIILTRK